MFNLSTNEIAALFAVAVIFGMLVITGLHAIINKPKHNERVDNGAARLAYFHYLTPYNSGYDAPTCAAYARASLMEKNGYSYADACMAVAQLMTMQISQPARH